MTEQDGWRRFQEADGVEDWRLVSEGACAYFRTGSFTASARLVQAISELSGIDDRQPDIDVRAGGVTVRLIANANGYYGPTEGHVELARRISAVAQELDTPASPSAVQSLLVIVERQDGSDVMPFWRAVLGYEPRSDTPEEDLVDPRGRGPGFWFETLDAPNQRGSRIHLAVWVPPDQAEARVAAALAEGGRMVRDTYAPSWWTLADAEGHEADVATSMGRI
jgi:4a-hydroxytetrahydrobiopterin dehydratase